MLNKLLVIVFVALIALQGISCNQELLELLKDVDAALEKFQKLSVGSTEQAVEEVRLVLNVNLEAVKKTIDDGLKKIQGNIGKGLAKIEELEDRARESGADLSECSSAPKNELTAQSESITGALKKCSNEVGEESKATLSEFRASKVEQDSKAYIKHLKSKNKCLELEELQCLQDQLEAINDRIFYYKDLLEIEIDMARMTLNAIIMHLGPCSITAEADSSYVTAGKVAIVQECFDNL